MIGNNSPDFSKFAAQQAEIPSGRIAVAAELPFSDDQNHSGTCRNQGDIAECQLSHAFLVGIMFAVSFKGVFPTHGDSVFCYETQGVRFPVVFHVSLNISIIPGLLLTEKHLKQSGRRLSGRILGLEK